MSKHHAAGAPSAAAPEAPGTPEAPETPKAQGAAPEGGAGPAPQGADPALRIAELEAKAAELNDHWLRAKAEAENARRRAAEDVAKAGKFAIEKFAAELLPVKDSLEAALGSAEQSAGHLRSGVELTLKQLSAAFGKSGITEIDPMGEKFDPHHHQAMQMVDSDKPANTVAQVLQKGYSLAERVLRPALVMVSKGKAAPEAEQKA
jgi:molecular chaperone GrpE